MHLEEEEIREFMQLWLEEFNEKLQPGEARQRAQALVELYALLAELPVAQSDPPSALPSDTA